MSTTHSILSGPGRAIALLGVLLLALTSIVLAGPAEPAAALTSTTYADDDDPGVTYTGSWATTTDSGYYDNSLHYSNDVGDAVSFVFTGSFIRVLAGTNTNQGQMGVQICNSSGTSCGAQSIMDQASNTLQKQQVVWADYDLGAGTHMIKLTILSTTTGTSTWIHIDAFAFGTPITGDRYVASTGCSDANAGTSSGSPWCTFNNLNGETFGPDARILLARGSSWNQKLGPLYGAGTPTDPITIDAYGSGNRPKIDRNRSAADRGVWLDNPDWWTIRNLEVMDTGAGIIAYFTTNGHEGLRFEDIYTHNNDVIHNTCPTGCPDAWVAQPDLPGMYHGAAIFITGNVPVTANEAAISDIVVSRVESASDSDPIDIAGFNPPGGGGLGGFLHTDLGTHAARDITIRDSYFHDALGAPNFDNVEDLNIYGNRIEGMCTAHQTIGTTGLFLWSTDDVTIANNVLGFVPYTASVDGTAIDSEAHNSDATFTANWIGGNQGAGVEFLSVGTRAGDHNTGHLAVGNAFQQNAQSTANQSGSIHYHLKSGIPQSGSATDNLYYESKGFTSTNSGSAPWTFTNNVPVSAAGVFAAGKDYTSTQGLNGWGYQSHNGSSWSNLSYDSAADRWGTASGFVSRFNTLPTACASCWSAHTWTAPQAGTVSLRGQVFKNDLGGDGVVVRITQNGTKIWPTSGATQAISANDRTGVTTNLSGVTVAAGDVIRFEVGAGAAGSNTGDQTSWAPIIGYTSITNAGVGIVQDTATGTGVNQVDYASGTWSTSGAVHYNIGTTTTAHYLVEFTGTQVTVHGGKKNDRGIAAFSICDALGGNCGTETLVDLYNPTLIADNVHWTSPLMKYGTYTVKVRTTNTKNASSSGRIVDLDYATVSTNGFVVNDDVTGSGENQVDYASGTWNTAGSVHYNSGSTTTAHLLVEFRGTQVVVIGGRNSDRGRSGYSICDAAGANCGAEVIIDQYASSLQLDQILWTSPVLTSGAHTIKIRTLNTKNASSSNFLVDFDRLIVN